MKYLFPILYLLILINSVNAQIAPPQAFNYSGVARNASNSPIANQTIGIQLSILKGSAVTGTVVYKENHLTNTDALGLFNIAVGTGAVQSGTFSTIDWSNDTYYLRVGLDATGGTNFVTMGSTQLLSVPYALFAKTADSLKSAAKINLSVSTSGDTLFVNGSYVIIPNISSANGVSLTTTSPTSITRTGANTGGNITNDGGFSITARGICYSTSPNPTLSNNVIQSGNGTGSFSVNISGLNYNTTYYVRAFATNSQGTFYGSQKSFITADLTFASLTTTIATSITANSCTTGGNISDDGGTTVTSRGVCYGTSFNPTIANSKVTSGSGSGIFSTILTGLTPNTMYYARAFATNTKGTAYGNQISFYTTSSGFSIGQNYDGGIIFYIDGTGQHGLIAAPNDQGTTQWGCSGTVISGANGTTIGSGQTNTTAIVTNCSTAGIAARICDDLVLGGKSDWFLPSEAELVMMYQNLPVQGLGGFTTGNYWSSSQSNDVTAVYVWFSQNGGYGGTIGKYVTNVNIRAIRKF